MTKISLSCLCNAPFLLPPPPPQVDDLKEKLAAQEVELKQKNEDADLLIKKVFATCDQWNLFQAEIFTTLENNVDVHNTIVMHM